MISRMWCLDFHAAYACRHSGECCQSGWAIPFTSEEATRVESLHLANALTFVRADGDEVAAFARKDGDRRCMFFEPGRRLCGIHRAGGERSLPVTCRMFPRVVLKDARGTFVTLSHYCPTAAAMLLDGYDGPAVVEAPASLIPSGALEGLDASDAWPPLLRPDVLMDHASYALWEQRALARLAEPQLTPAQALEAVGAATATLMAWSPGTIPLSEAVAQSFDGTTDRFAAGAEPESSLAALVLDSVPVELLRGTPFTDFRSGAFGADAAIPYAGAIKRWLAARLFGTWIAYQANSLGAVSLYLRACLSVLHAELSRDGGASDERGFVEAVRRGDQLIVHLADSQHLAKMLSGSGFSTRDRDRGLPIRN
jgi:Fe-S-cluster containining protein